MKNPIHSIHFMEGRVVVFRKQNDHDYNPTPTSLERLTKLLRRITPFNAFVLPYPNGWSVTFNEAVYHHLNIVNNGGKLPGSVCSPPIRQVVVNGP